MAGDKTDLIVQRFFLR